MTWGTYYFFYECPQCGKKYRYELEGSADEEFGFCPGQISPASLYQKPNG